MQRISGLHKNNPQSRAAFTLVEVIIVVVILAIVAVMAVPMFSSAESFQIRAAANMVAADLEYARSMAISHGRSYRVVFDCTNESYQIQDDSGSVIEHTVKVGSDYIVSFSSDSRLQSVDIESASFDSTPTVQFDYLGSPYNGNGNSLNSGVIVLSAGGLSMKIHVEPVTGYVSIE